MNIQELLEKFQGILSEEDLTNIEQSIDTLIKEATEKAVDAQIEELVEASLDKIKEMKAELIESYSTEAAEEFKKIREADAKEAAAQIKNIVESQAFEVAEFIQKREEEITMGLEEKMISTIDSAIDQIIAENFSEDLIEKIAINETYKPIVEGMQKLLADKHLSVDSEGYQIVTESKETIAKQESTIADLNKKIESLTSIIESTKVEAEVAKAEKLIIEKCEGLSDSQKKTVRLVAEALDTSVIPTKIDSIIESVVAVENEEIISEKYEDLSEEEEILESLDTLELNKKTFVDTEKAERNAVINRFKQLMR